MQYCKSIACAALLLTLNLALTAQNQTIDDRISFGITVEAAYRYHLDGKQHEVDIPNSTASLGFDMGNGWSTGSDITFGLIRNSSQMGIDEATIGGHEVSLEQLWIEKSWNESLNLRVGHLIVPIGAVSAYNHPDLFASTYRPLGESCVVPDTWHENGVSLWGIIGRRKQWRYELLVLPAPDNTLYEDCNWNLHDNTSMGLQRTNRPSIAARIDNHSIPGLRMSLSGYAGNSLYRNLTSSHDSETSLILAAFDFAYDRKGLRIIGNADLGNLQLEDKHERTSLALGLQVGYDILSLWSKEKQNSMKFAKQLYLFARYDSHNMPFETDRQEEGFQTLCGGINYCATPDVVVKAEGGVYHSAISTTLQPWLGLSILWTAVINE